jgi:hypothetical protein
MSRGTEGAPVEKSEVEIPVDPVLIRGWLPDDSLLAGAAALPEGPVNMAFLSLSEAQRQAAAGLAAPEPVDEKALVAVDPAAGSVKGIYILSLPNTLGFAWVIGPVDAGPATSYNKTTVADLKAGRPDLGEVLNLPRGFLAIIGAKGLTAIFNPNNENLLKLESEPISPASPTMQQQDQNKAT